MKTVLFYENNPEKTMEDLMAVFPRHDEIQKQFAAQGKILGIGPFTDNQRGAMGIFTDRESAEEFLKVDPFVLEGMVSNVTIREWHDELL